VSKYDVLDQWLRREGFEGITVGGLTYIDDLRVEDRFYVPMAVVRCALMFKRDMAQLAASGVSGSDANVLG
jgi:hypothetical protein